METIKYVCRVAKVVHDVRAAHVAFVAQVNAGFSCCVVAVGCLSLDCSYENDVVTTANAGMLYCNRKCSSYDYKGTFLYCFLMGLSQPLFSNFVFFNASKIKLLFPK